MYQCQLCAQTIAARTPMVKLTVERRVYQHPQRDRAHPVIDRSRPTGRRQRKRRDDPGGTGLQIVRTLHVCPAYASGHTPTI